MSTHGQSKVGVGVRATVGVEVRAVTLRRRMTQFGERGLGLSRSAHLSRRVVISVITVEKQNKIAKIW